MAPRIDRIPVVLLTGFLGSGKTTLLRDWLRLPQAADTAVLINELGAIGLDHQLAWGAADTTLVLENGCVCCSVQQDLAAALEDLFWKRLHRKIPRFKQVVIETTGIADPRRIVGLFSGESVVAQRYVLTSVLCTVDGLLGEQQLRAHPDCLAQAAIADLILVTKTDMADEASLARLEQELGRVNAAAPCRRTSTGVSATVGDLFSWVADGPQREARGLAAPHAETVRDVQRGPLPAFEAHPQISSFVLRLNKFAHREALDAALSAVLSRHGASMLRIKGLVEVVGEAQPAVVQVVGDRVFPIDRIAPDAQWEGPGFLVFITLSLSREQFLQAGTLASAQWAEAV
jgi:G3E family GTPase